MTSINSILDKMRPAFRTVEFCGLQRKGSLYARQTLHRLKTRGKIIHIRRGWWAKPDALAETIAGIISYPGSLSFHSALYLHGLTTQIPRHIQIAVGRKARRYEVLDTQVQEYRLPKKMLGGFEVRDHMPLARAEKAFADCLRLPRACPDIILAEAFPKLDENKISAFCSGPMKRRLEKVRRLCSQEMN